MKFWYEIIESRCIDVDFQKVYDYIRDNESNINNHYDVYLEFINNYSYYLDKLYKLEDFVEEDNDHAVQELINSWKDWLEEEFGKDWDNYEV